MNIPKQVKIAGRTFKVVYDDNYAAKDGLAGRYDDNQQMITLQNGFYNPEKIEQTFWHEIVHALDVNYLNSKLDEDQIDAMAVGLHAFLKDNKIIK